MIALSFTRKGSDIDVVRALLGPKGILIIKEIILKLLLK